MSYLLFHCRRKLSAQFELDALFESARGVTALFGPSGSGKTTILNLLAGVIRPDEGRIELEGDVLDDTQARVHIPPEQRRIGFVFQDQLLFPHLSAADNLRFGMGRPRAGSIDFNKVVEILEVGPLLDRYPAALSGGQRQRIALGRAILRAPRLLLMDEPLTGLEERLKDRILTYLGRLLTEFHLPTLFVSHDQTDVRRLADWVIVLESGRVIAAGPPDKTVDRAVLKTPAGPVNLLHVSTVRSADGHFEGQLFGKPFAFIAADASSVAIGATALVQFRPSDVTLTLAPAEKLSARNRLAGEVREVLQLPERAFVAIDIGQLIWAEVLHETVRELSLSPGAKVTCLIKATAATAVV